jgi:hypothetical protein
MGRHGVYTVNDYYDGPRLGIADVDGVPHIYEAEFDHSSDEYGDTYFVSPVDESLLALVLEDWEIWLRVGVGLQTGCRLHRITSHLGSGSRET